MESSSSKLMYIGAGLHLDPIDHFKNATEFVFVDTLPRSEFDCKGKFSETFYNEEFIDTLKTKCREKGFLYIMDEVLDETYFTRILSWYQRLVWLNKVKQTFPYICPTRLTFFNNETNQILKYYVSTNIEHNMPLNSLLLDLSQCDGWIVSGFHPPMSFVYSIWAPLTMYGYSDTVFKTTEDTLVQWIYQETENGNQISFLNRYFVCNKDTGEMIECDDVVDLNNRAISIRKLIAFG
jgi:hypothetical protein